MTYRKMPQCRNPLLNSETDSENKSKQTYNCFLRNAEMTSHFVTFSLSFTWCYIKVKIQKINISFLVPIQANKFSLIWNLIEILWFTLPWDISFLIKWKFKGLLVFKVTCLGDHNLGHFNAIFVKWIAKKDLTEDLGTFNIPKPSLKIKVLMEDCKIVTYDFKKIDLYRYYLFGGVSLN